MTEAEWDAMSGADQLRLIASNIDCTNETFNGRYSADQLLKIFRALVLSEWDIMPDCWTQRQIREALKGKPPKFDDRERPLYK